MTERRREREQAERQKLRLYAKGKLISWGGGFIKPISTKRAAELRAMPYSEYTLSPEWRRKRAICCDGAGGRCERCGKTRRTLQVHHLTYENLPFEQRGDLRALCGTCHLDCHPEVIKPSVLRLNAWIRSADYERVYGKHPNPDSVWGLDANGRPIKSAQEAQ